MPRGPAPPYRQRKEPVRDDWLQQSVERANGRHHPETGHYAPLVIADCGSREEANEEIRALHRAGRRLGLSVMASVTRRGNVYDVEFRAVHKSYARAYVVRKYGQDRTRWPYDPRRPGAVSRETTEE